MSVFRNLLMQSTGWLGKPADWSDIRKDCPAESIALYAGVKSDYSAYDNLGFTVATSNGSSYKVFIDGVQYGTTYASGTKCEITWSSLALDTGDDITTPTTLKAHKIWIEPATSGNSINGFMCRKVGSASGYENQGVLWVHFNLTNTIQIAGLLGNDNAYRNMLAKAITAKNNLITYSVAAQVAQSGYYCLAPHSSLLEYLPILKAVNQSYPAGTYYSFVLVPAKKVVIKNNKGTENCALLTRTRVEEFDVENGLTLGTGLSQFNDAHEATKLKKFPKITQNKAENFQMYNCPALEPVNIDDRFNDIRKVFRFYGTQSVPTPALKSLRVSNEAPFDYTTAPQIQVDYTDMNRDALVQLFNDLPTVNAGQIISITGATGSEDLTEEEVEIAENKGWTITGGPIFYNLYAYTDGSNNTVYSTDNLPTTSSELFNSTGTKLTGNPTAVTQGIINLSNYNNNVNITDGVASGFGQYKSLQTTSTFNPSNKPWSWVFKIKTPSSVSSRKIFVGCGQSYYTAGFGAELTASGKFFCGFTNGGYYATGWAIGSITEPTVVDTNTWYYVKPYFTGTKYQLAIKKEGDSTWSEGGTEIESTTAINSNGSTLRIGADVASSSGWYYNFNGSIDLKETYSEIDGVKTHYYTSTLTYNGVVYTRDYDKDILR